MRPYALYREFDERGLDIKEYFALRDAKVLRRLLKKVRRPGMRVAEIGAWKGCSTAIIADFVARHSGGVLSIDTWRGNPGSANLDEAASKDIMAVHRANMEALGLTNGVTMATVDGSSADLAAEYNDGAFDLVFIDADHRYTPFVADLKAWWPKTSGIICGHDHDPPPYVELSREDQRSTDRTAEDEASSIGHSGVVRGCHDFFGAGAYRTASPKSSMWWAER